MKEGSPRKTIPATCAPQSQSAAMTGDVRAWLDAAQRPEVGRAIDDVHSEIERTIERASPRCDQSGRCCRFGEFGHRLYITGLEAALTVSRLRTLETRPGLDGPSIAQAVRAGACPFQINSMCGAHSIRPAGCRVYFCDRSWSGVMSATAERAVVRVRAIHDQYDIAYRYAEWRSLLSVIELVAGPIAPAGSRLNVLTIEGRRRPV